VQGRLDFQPYFDGHHPPCCNLQDAPQRREHRTAPGIAFPPTSPDGRAVGTGRGKGVRWGVLAFGEIGYEGGLGDVASAAVIS
jgi:hypothetical protein